MTNNNREESVKVWIKEAKNIEKQLKKYDVKVKKEERKSYQNQVATQWMGFSNLRKRAEREGILQEEKVQKQINQTIKAFKSFEDILPILNLL